MGNQGFHLGVTQLAVDYYNGLTNPQARPRLQVICSPKRRIQEWVSALESEAELEEITTDELALADLFGEQSKVDVLLYQLPEQELLMLLYIRDSSVSAGLFVVFRF